MIRQDDAPLGSPGSPGGRILIVDDDPVARRVLLSILERAHYDVMASTDGREAWAELAAARIDLVITDREMPAMNGVELLRAVRQSPRHGGVPVVMLTGTTLETASDEADAAGASAFLTKPVSSRELLETVERLLRDFGRQA
jgi:two-component system chemotaxis response regulator CheY